MYALLYFARQNITEDIITELSRFHEFAVIARNSSFRYKGLSPKIEDVGRELGVKYVVEGSVRKIGNRVRVTCAVNRLQHPPRIFGPSGMTGVSMIYSRSRTK